MTELSQPNLKVSVNCKSTFNTLYHTWSEAEYNFHRVNPHWEAMTVKFSDSTGFLIFLGFASISVALTLLGVTYMFRKHCKCCDLCKNSVKHDVNDIYGTYARWKKSYNKRHIPGAGTVRENMGTATKSMLPTQMTIMARNQLLLSSSMSHYQ